MTGFLASYMYNTRCVAFVHWPGEQQVDPHQTNITQICGFLQVKLEEGLQYQTLKCYVAAILAFHKEYNQGSLGQVRVVQDIYL